ncbi:MAG: hypothetical protein NZ891_04770 [bacterium]|nr:hypothetical protein [bacterium]MDW8164037.1 hypothetical protein [Candidatus Omnitrophota bacterium]
MEIIFHNRAKLERRSWMRDNKGKLIPAYFVFWGQPAPNAPDQYFGAIPVSLHSEGDIYNIWVGEYENPTFSIQIIKRVHLSAHTSIYSPISPNDVITIYTAGKEERTEVLRVILGEEEYLTIEPDQFVKLKIKINYI